MTSGGAEERRARPVVPGWAGMTGGSIRSGGATRVAGVSERNVARGLTGSGLYARACVDAAGGTSRPGPALGAGRVRDAMGGAPAITGAEVTSDAGRFRRFGATGLRFAQFVSATADSAPGTARFA